MSAERSIEVTGDSVDDAIAKGLAELGAAPTDVIVEVLEEPSRGVFGLGARPAKVRLKVFRSAMPQPAPAQPPQPAPRPVNRSERQEVYVEHEDEDESVPLLDEMHEIQDDASLDEDARVSKVVLGLLLEKMDIFQADIVIRRAQFSEDGESNPWLLDVTGSNLSALIGRRGETLAALQYITRLIASRELQHRANIVVDVGGYKIKRSRMLRDLAMRMADQAIQSNRVVTLEPMPPYERRIIHLTLRQRDDVQTKSIGEGSARKVTIIPNLS